MLQDAGIRIAEEDTGGGDANLIVVPLVPYQRHQKVANLRPASERMFENISRCPDTMDVGSSTSTITVLVSSWRQSPIPH